MKNKKTAYILLPLVLAIWGGVFYRIFAELDDPMPQYASESSKTMDVTKEAVVDTFSIIGNYRDPFLDGKPPKLAENIDNIVIEKPIERVVEPVVWPAVSYGGIIKNKQSDKKIIIIQVEGKDYLMKEGEIALGVLVQKVYKDSVALLFRKNKKTILKNQ